MALIIQKYGGDALGDKGKGKKGKEAEPLFGAQFILEKFQQIAARVKLSREAGDDVVVVVSAMGDATDRLLRMAKQLSPKAPARELDMLMMTGEQQSIALLAIALGELGVPSSSFTGHQVGITTKGIFGKARIQEIATERLEKAIKNGVVPVIAGFQGATQENEYMTLGRGGSDITAVALAAVLNAEVCEFYKDVDGIFTTDPRICPTAKKIERISYDEMLELSSLGAGVLHCRSVEFAKNYGVRLHVRSFLHEQPGTFVVPEEKEMEDVVVSGIAFNRGEAKITIPEVPDHPGVAAEVFGELGAAEIVVDMIIQNQATAGRNDISFTVGRADFDEALEISGKLAERLGAQPVIGDLDIAKVSAVGVGMRSHADVASKMFKALADKNINIQMISTSEIKISCVLAERDLDEAVRAIHEAFENTRKPVAS